MLKANFHGQYNHGQKLCMAFGYKICILHKLYINYYLIVVGQLRNGHPRTSTDEDTTDVLLAYIVPYV